MLDPDVVNELTASKPGEPVVSIYARTDPRDPANLAKTPAWLVAVRNGLGAITDQLEADGNRDHRLAFRELRERLTTELVSVWPKDRGRSFAWFARLGGDEERMRLQLPVRDDAVVWDDRPFVWPLVDAVDRGAPVGVLVVDLETVRLVHIQLGEATEPDDSTFVIEKGDWRHFGGTAGGSPRRGMLTTAHQERYDARVDKQRHRLFGEAGAAAAKRLDELGWERIVLIAEDHVASDFTAALPGPLADRIDARMVANLGGQDAGAIAEACEPVVHDLWLKEVSGQVELAYSRARAGEGGALGVEETVDALAAGRVSRLLVDPVRDFGVDQVPDAIGGGAGHLLAERAIEAAVGTGAGVSCVPAEAADQLAEAGGIAALLRY